MRLGEMAGTDMGPTEAAQAVITECGPVKSEDAAEDPSPEHVTDSDSPVSDIVRAAILETGYETRCVRKD
jgi:hypothetical protein